MVGVDSSFGCAMLVGYHAMAGTLGGIMEHTITGGVHRLWVNGVETGEMGLSAGVAGTYGVPLTMVSSDAAGCAEAATLIPGLETAVTKEGYGRYMGRLLHPSETAPLIEAAAERAVLRAEEIAPTRYAEPTTIRVEFNRAEEADMGARLVTEPVRVDAYTLEGTFDTYTDATWFAREPVSRRVGVEGAFQCIRVHSHRLRHEARPHVGLFGPIELHADGCGLRVSCGAISSARRTARSAAASMRGAVSLDAAGGHVSSIALFGHCGL